MRSVSMPRRSPISTRPSGRANNAAVHLNRAQARLAAGQEIQAIDDLNEALRQEPRNPTMLHERGKAWKATENYDLAVADFTEAIRWNPRYAAAYASRGFVWFAKHEPAKAVADFDAVIRLDPNSAMAFNNRGYNRQLLGQYPAALQDYEQAIRLAPDYVLAYQNKAWLLATCPDDAVRNGAQALAAAKKALELVDEQHWSDWKALAAALAETGDFEKAVKLQAKVVEAVPAEQKQDEQGILKRYQARQPHRFSLSAKPAP